MCIVYTGISMMKQKAILNTQWTQNEITSVLKLLKEKKSIDDIAKRHNKPPFNVKSLLKTLAATMYTRDNMSFDEIYQITGVQKSALIVSPSGLKDKMEIPLQEDYVAIEMGYISPDPSDSQDRPLVNIPEDSPFNVTSICEHISTPLIETFSTCSTLLSGLINQSPR